MKNRMINWRPMGLAVAMLATMLMASACQPDAPAPPRRRADGEPSPGALEPMLKQWQARPLQPPRRVSAGWGAALTTVVLRQTHWWLRSSPQSVVLGMRLKARAMKLSEPERSRLLRREDRHLQIWWRKARGTQEFARSVIKKLAGTTKPHPHHREIVYLGRTPDFDWYAFAPIPDWIELQRSLGAHGGSNPQRACVRGLAIKDRHGHTAGRCHQYLADSGPVALPAVRAAVTAKRPEGAAAVKALGQHRDPAITSYLLSLLAQAGMDNAAAARAALLARPRPEARVWYVRWLAAGIGTGSVWGELQACAKTNARKAAPHLAAVMARPHRFAEYRFAFELHRRWAGRAISEAIRSAERDAVRFGYADAKRRPKHDTLSGVEMILSRAKDREAVLVISVSLALYVSKGDYRATNAVGRRLLAALAGGRKLLRTLIGAGGQDKKRLAALLSSLPAAAPGKP